MLRLYTEPEHVLQAWPYFCLTLLNFPFTAGNLNVGHYFPRQLGQLFGGANFLFG